MAQTKKSMAMQAAKAKRKASATTPKASLEQFKMEAAKEVGVTLNKGDNGNLTSREAGSVGGQMVKKMIESYEKKNG